MNRKKMNSYDIEVIRRRGDRLYKTALDFLKDVRPFLQGKRLMTKEIGVFFPNLSKLRMYEAMAELEEIGAVKAERTMKPDGKLRIGAPIFWSLDNEEFFK